jgi:hypothetical protein
VAHNRRLVIGSVALTQARLPARRIIAAVGKVRDELERELIDSGCLEGAPFKWVGLIIREGLVDSARPEYRPVDPADGELPLVIEIDTHRLLDASDAQIEKVYREATLRALLQAWERHDLNSERLSALLERT